MVSTFMRIAAAIVLISLSCSTRAFDAGPHFDMTADALGFEGFGKPAVQAVQLSNWAVDLYELREKADFQTHSSWSDAAGQPVAALLTAFKSRSWSEEVLEAAGRLHMDSRGSSGDYSREWQRLAQATLAALLKCARNSDAESALIALGISLHAVQDFYAHTNWAEPEGERVKDGYSGPGWAARGQYGSHPTWFDIDPAARGRAKIYCCSGGPPEIGHGDWSSTANGAGRLAMNKDSAGRPLFAEAYMTATLATRQWIRAARVWLGNESFWRSMTGYSGSALGLDQAVLLSSLAGHWNGSTGASPPQTHLVARANSRFSSQKGSNFSRKWEEQVLSIAQDEPEESPVPVQKTSAFAREVEFVDVRIGQIGINPAAEVVGEPAWIARGEIGGQSFRSALMFGSLEFGFGPPQAGPRFLKMLPKVRSNLIPLRSVRLDVRTSEAAGSGSESAFRLKLSDTLAFDLPKLGRDESAKGPTSAYKFVPPPGLSMDNVQYLQLEAARGGALDDWSLAGVRVLINGETVFSNESIGARLSAQAPALRLTGLASLQRRTDEIPFALSLWHVDLKSGTDDAQVDINGLRGRRDLVGLFSPSTKGIRLDVQGKGSASTAGDEDPAFAEMRLSVTMHALRPPG
jgi:hypothetical protein